MPIARSGAVRIHYEVRGFGEPLLLIMGFRSSSRLWRQELLDLLSRNFQVITFDNRGTGASDKPNAVYTIAMMADDAVSVLDELQLSRAHVFGVSMGGMVAQELTLRYPQRLDRLILGCTTFDGQRAAIASLPAYSRLLTASNLPQEETIRRRWRIMLSPQFTSARPDVLDELTEQALAYPTPEFTAVRQAMAIQWFDSSSRLSRIAAPTLVVTGSADALIPSHHSHLLAQRIPDSTLEVLQGAGHGFFWERPGHLVDLLTAFCKASTAARRTHIEALTR
jgi:pimeloyl-ACP methyl ester carboxylesterase